MEMHPLYLFLDPYLIWFYRLTGQAEVNFFLGTFGVAVLALLVGEFTSFLASFVVRRHFERVAGEAKKYQDLSMEALKAGDRPAYEAANQVANEAFGKSFFMQLTLSATLFWPIFFVLGWMQSRFLEVEFPLPFVGFSLGYIGVFIILYAAAYFLFKRVKKKLPSWLRAKAPLNANPDQPQDLKNLAHMLPPGRKPEET
jgi:uncharacterized membrane protein (DUF106 family)